MELSVKGLLKAGAVICVLALVWVHYTRYMDFGNGCFIRIVPSYLEFSNANIMRAISILKNGSPSDYAELCRYVKVIDPSPSCGGFGGGCFYHHESKRIYIQTGQNDLLSTAGIIVHELCHAKQNDAGRPINETECYKEDGRVFRALAVF